MTLQVYIHLKPGSSSNMHKNWWSSAVWFSSYQSINQHQFVVNSDQKVHRNTQKHTRPIMPKKS